MYVYIKNGTIFHKSMEKKWINGAKIVTSDISITERVIFEDGIVKRYEDSKQYRIDHNIETLEHKIQKLETKVKKQEETLEVRVRKYHKLEDTDPVLPYHYNLYYSNSKKDV